MIDKNAIRLCIYHVLHNSIENPKIKSKQNHFKQYNSTTNKKWKYNSAKYINSDLLDSV